MEDIKYKIGDIVKYKAIDQEVRGIIKKIKNDNEFEIEVALFYKKSDEITKEKIYVKRKDIKPITYK